jgi:hypothetical protein
VWERIVGGVGEQRLRHINDSVLSLLKIEGIRFVFAFVNYKTPYDGRSTSKS